tara:strand:- start:170 stop:508 length:339 start_codon:yes stop_codon:yes gene_type:complete
MATFTWTISTLERDLIGDLAGGVIVAHWRCNAEQTQGSGDDAITFHATSYGTAGFTPDPSAEGYIAYDDLTESDVLGWVWGQSENWQTNIEDSLQAQIDGQITPATADGVPW